MSLTSSSIIPSKSLIPSNKPHQPCFFTTKPSRSTLRISAVHSADPSKSPPPIKTPAATSTKATTVAPTVNVGAGKWTVESWKSKKALQLPEYPDKEDFDSVLKTLDAFPPIVFAGEARSLEEKLAEAAMGNAFLLQGGDCAESFKEFNANNIRDTFRILLQMGVVLMFGGQMPVIKVFFFFSIPN